MKLFDLRSVLEILRLQERQLRGEYDSNLSNHERHGEIFNCLKMQMEHPLKLLACSFKTSA